ncbi:uncharacterized protein LOC111047660 isoform X3 [Nilaparvata lugens]|uniref:uncharacterized protein LOC111047660 isoform X3 n=1 Tax=Nilaparvata lugens TaxID=108931 RepID=UPI00193D1D8A|nr:uncharacterized protein LOC111047660 isoform X3 [Nilaparvata lugens]
MHKFVSSLFGFSAVVIFILQLHVDEVCARNMTIDQPRFRVPGFKVELTLLPPRVPPKTREVQGTLRCAPTVGGSGNNAVLPHFRIITMIGQDITNRWHPQLKLFKCTDKNGVRFYRMKAIYDSKIRVIEISYPDDKTPKVFVEESEIKGGAIVEVVNPTAFNKVENFVKRRMRKRN